MQEYHHATPAQPANAPAASHSTSMTTATSFIPPSAAATTNPPAATTAPHANTSTIIRNIVSTVHTITMTAITVILSAYLSFRASAASREIYTVTPAPDRVSPGIIPQSLIPPPSGSNHLITYLKTMIPSSAIDRIIADYRLASTPDQAIIFLQIDQDNQCRTGKIMQYNPATGHRIKDPDKPGRINWLHSILKRKKQLPPDWQLTQCLFGEHLLPQHPDKTIALVESEKTAIICSAMMPQYLWLATGGKSGLTSERLSSLKGRKIIVFPDIDAFKDWQQKIFTFPHLDIRISRLLEDNAIPADRAAHIDLADWILKYLETNNN